MNTITLIFSTLLLVQAALGQTTILSPTPSDDFKCPAGVPDGTTYPDPKDCTKYFVCTNGLAWEEHCPAGLWFDPITDQCNWPETVSCSASPPPTAPSSSTIGSGYTCPGGTGAPEASYPDPLDCTKYFVCTGGVAFPKQCPDGLFYNPVTSQCDWPDSVSCSAVPSPSTPLTSTLSPSSTKPASSTMSPSPTSTPSSTLENSNPTTLSPSSTTLIPSSTSGGVEFKCPVNGADGAAYSHPQDCSKFYVCTGGEAILEDCPAGLWFDPTNGLCNWPEVVDCDASRRPIATASSFLKNYRH